jgi:hypothetical protein
MHLLKLTASNPVEQPNNKSVAIVLPIVVEDVNHPQELLQSWIAVGKPCVAEQATDLWFYVNKGESSIDAAAFLHAIAEHHSINQHRQCFGDIRVMYANLTGEEDIYPAGPSNMFFNIYLNANMSYFRALYDFMYWMEPDVQPAQPGWLDCIHDAANSGHFWMKGSLTLGPHLNEAVKERTNWDWIGHINGNALYALQDATFEQFLRVVDTYEPPSHFWKPFDVSIWRTLHAFPHMWTVYQQYRSKFVYSDFTRHYAFGIGTQTDQHTCLLHGAPHSAGIIIFNEKFNSNMPPGVVFNDVLSASHKVSILMRAFNEDLPSMVVAVQSAMIYMPNFHEIVVVVDNADVNLARNSMVGMPVIIKSEPRYFSSDHLQQMYTKLMASTYCSGTYIFHLDPDAVIVRQVLNRDLFWLNKPILVYDEYTNLPGYGDIDNELQHWRLGTTEALGAKVDFEYATSNTHLYPRNMYARARETLERRFDSSLINFLRSRVPTMAEAAERVEAGQISATSRMFSEFNYIGAYLWHFEHSSVAWIHASPAIGDSNGFPMPIIPDFTCQGNSRRAKMLDDQIEHEKALKAALDTGMCGCLCSSDGICC